LGFNQNLLAAELTIVDAGGSAAVTKTFLPLLLECHPLVQLSEEQLD
jgi:hypothetical protein